MAGPVYGNGGIYAAVPGPLNNIPSSASNPQTPGWATLAAVPPPGLLTQPAAPAVPPAFVQVVASGTLASSVTLVLTVSASSTTTGNVLSLTARMSAARSLSSVADSRGNTWQVDANSGGAQTNAGAASAVITTPLVSGDTITLTYSGSCTSFATALEASGIKVTAGHPVVDVSGVLVAATSTNAPETSAAAGAGSDFVVSCVGPSSGTAVCTLTTATDADSGGTWTVVSPNTGLGTAWQVAGGSGTKYIASWTCSGGTTNTSGVTVAYLPAAGGGPATLPGTATLAGSGGTLNAQGSATAALTGGGGVLTASAGHLPISAAAFGTGTVNTATTSSAPAPAAVAVGDLLVIWMTNATSTVTYTITGTSGWSSAGPSTGSNSTATVFYKNADSTDVALSVAAGSYTLTASAGHSGEGIIVCAPGYSFDPSAPANAGQFAATASGSSYPATGVTTANPSDTVMVFGMVRIASGTPAVMTLPAGFATFVAQANTTASTSANVGVIAGTLTQSSAGATGTQTVTAAANSAGGAFLIALTTGAAAPPAGTVVQQVAGAPTSGGFQVVTKLTGATSVRLAYSTSSAMTSPSYVAAQTPDSLGYVRHTVSGLSAQSTYFYQAADTPSGGAETLTGPVGQGKTLPAAGSPANFTVALGACVNANDALPPTPSDAAMLDWNAYNADLNIFTGDFDYSGTVSTVLASQVGTYETQIAHWASYGQMVSSHWGYYCRSDHESGPDNGDSNNTYTATNIAAAQQVFPFGTLGDTVNTPVHGLYQSWVVGRVRFIMVDVRNTDRSPGGNTDNSSKTMLGATQLAWLQSQLIQSEPLKVIVGDPAWMGTPSIVSGPDKWWSYDTERQAILAYIAANASAVKGVMYWHGDTHLVGYTPATANTSWGGFSVYCAAPMVNDGGGLQTGTFTAKYNNASGECRQYGRIAFTDDGTKITVTFQGWDAVNAVAQVTQTDIFATGTVLTGGSGVLTASQSMGAALTGGGGTLSAGSPRTQAPATLAGGGGTLTAGSPLVQAPATLAGGGGTLAAASPRTQAPATLAGGSGTLTGLLSLTQSPATLPGGGGTLATAGVITQPAAMTLTGSGGTLTGLLSLDQAPAVLSGGSGTLTAAAGGAVSGSATLTGSGGTLTAPNSEMPAGMTLPGGSGLMTAGAATIAPAALTGGGGTLVTGSAQSPAALTLAGGGGILTAAHPATAAPATLAGSGGVLTAGSPVTAAPATLTGSGGTLTASAPQTVVPASLAGGGGVLASLAGTAAPATLAGGGGTITALAGGAVSGSAVLTGGSGTLAAVGTQTIPGAAALAGGGGTLASSAAGQAGAALAGGGGTLTTHPATVAPAALAGGAGTLATAAAMPVPATLAGGGGTLATAANITQSATLTGGPGTLNASAPNGANANLAGGPGTLTVTAQAQGATAVLAGGQGTIQAGGAANATLTGGGGTLGTSPVAQPAALALTGGNGTLAANGSGSPTATLTGGGGTLAAAGTQTVTAALAGGPGALLAGIMGTGTANLNGSGGTLAATAATQPAALTLAGGSGALSATGARYWNAALNGSGGTLTALSRQQARAVLGGSGGVLTGSLIVISATVPALPPTAAQSGTAGTAATATGPGTGPVQAVTVSGSVAAVATTER